MFRLRRWYNQNSKTIWKVTGIVVFLILILQLVNYFAGKDNDLDNINLTIGNSTQKQYTDLSLSTDKSVLSNDKISSSQKDSIETINDFFAYCNEGKVEEAYKLLTDECKEEMYPKLKNFKYGYYKQIFNGNKKNITVENWTSDIYKIEISDDFLSTGVYDKSSIRQDYITIKETEDNEYKLNINSYIGRTEINESDKFINDIELTVQSKDTYMDYEIYTFQIKNASDTAILLDTLEDINSMYIEDNNGIHHEAYTHEISTAELMINAYGTKNFKIKYYNKYISEIKIESINFSNVIIDYNSYSKLENKELYNNYCEFEIDL